MDNQKIIQNSSKSQNLMVRSDSTLQSAKLQTNSMFLGH